jgi:hypothetical protein
MSSDFFIGLYFCRASLSRSAAHFSGSSRTKACFFPVVYKRAHGGIGEAAAARAFRMNPDSIEITRSGSLRKGCPPISPQRSA